MERNALDAPAPSQPRPQAGLDQAPNPISKTRAEDTNAHDPAGAAQPTIDHRAPHDVPSSYSDEGTATSLGRGETGNLTQRDLPESDAQNYSSNPNQEGEQMRAPGEGDVAEAVTQGAGKTGAGGEQESLVQNMDAKTEAHRQALHERGQRTGTEIDDEEKEDWTGKKEGVDVRRAFGGREIAVVEAPEN